MGVMGGHFKAAMADQFLLVCIRRLDIFHHGGESVAATMGREQVATVWFLDVQIDFLQADVEYFFSKFLCGRLCVGKEQIFTFAEVIEERQNFRGYGDDPISPGGGF